MQVDHLAIDGSIVQMTGDADLSGKVTATGWAVSPALLQSHPFAVQPPRHSHVIEEAAREVDDLEVLSTDTFSMKGGELRVGVVDLPNAHGGRRQLTVGAWEGRNGSLSTSIVGKGVEKLVEVFDTLEFSENDLGVKVDSPVVPRPRAPEVAKFVPDLGVVAVHPAIPVQLERVPRSRGQRTRHGELFRTREGSRALLFISTSSVVDIHPQEEAEDDRLLEFANSLEVRWLPRGRGAR